MSAGAGGSAAGAGGGSAGAGLLRLPRRVLFGVGALAAIGDAVAELGGSALVCTDATLAGAPPVTAAVAGLRAAGIEVRVFDGCQPDVPLASVAAATELQRRQPSEVLVGVGGGSCIDTAKALALFERSPEGIEGFYGENLVPPGLAPVVAVPTTAGTGSEVTPVAVVSDPERGLKVGISSPHLVPALAICDPQTTLGCPPAVTGTAGIDALIHAVESYCAPPRGNPWDAYPGDVFRGRDPLSRPFALPAIERIAASLERAYADGADLEARESMLLGSLWAGISFGHQGTAAAHALQYPVGSATATATPHGLGVGLLAPYTLEAARPEVDRDLAEVATALGVGGTDDSAAAAIAEIERLGRAVGLPRSLADLGLARERLPELATQAAKIERLLRNSPRPAGRDDLLRILEAAWAGDRALLRTAS